MKGQSIIEFAYIYSIISVAIIVIIAIVVSLLPGVFNPQVAQYTTGFNGLKITSQNYINNTLILSFQNLLNENIDITNIYLIQNGQVSTNYKCSSNYLPALAYDLCNMSAKLPPNFYVTIEIQYTPANSTFKKNINITGFVQG